jgi:uncharacterized membrane protein YbhN (UPF0104 family)
MGALPHLASRPAGGLRLLAADVAPGAAAARGRLARVLAVVGAAAVAVLVVFHGRDFASALGRAAHASGWLVAAAALFEAASVAGYVVLFHRVVAGASPRLRARDSYDITLAGTTATRLLPTAGLGGAAVAVWALRGHGLRAREIAERMVAFLLILYAVYMGALAASGAAVALGSGGERILGVVGLALGAGIAALVVLVMSAPGFVASALARAGRGSGRTARAATRVEQELPTLRASLRRAAGEVRHPSLALVGAIAWWAFDMAVLYAMLSAFAHAPAIPAFVLAYFLGTMFNVVPLPGTLSGGLTGMLIALGTPAVPALAAVLAYRAIAVWGPAACGLASIGRLRTTVAAWRSAAA